MNTKLIVAFASVIVAGLIGFGLFLALKPYKAPPRTVALSADYQQHLKDGYWVRGNPSPKVTVTEFADFQCPACHTLEPVLAATITQTADVAQIQFKHYPLEQLHDKADKAALGAEAAGRQGKFWPMHDMLYAQWVDWKDQSPLAFDDTLKGYAKQLGLDTVQFQNDMVDPSIFDVVTANKAAGDAVHLTGTPFVLLNGVLLEKPALAPEALAQQFRAAIK